MFHGIISIENIKNKND
jgi:hypothetical protein